MERQLQEWRRALNFGGMEVDDSRMDIQDAERDYGEAGENQALEEWINGRAGNESDGAGKH